LRLSLATGGTVQVDQLQVLIEEEGQPLRAVDVVRLPCRIGRARDADVALAGWRVGRVHAEIHRVGRGLRLTDLGTLGGTTVNGERVAEFGPLSDKDEIIIAGYRLRLAGPALRAGDRPLPVDRPVMDPGCTVPRTVGAGVDAGLVQAARVRQLETVPWRRLVHRRLLDLIDLRRSNLSQFSTDELRQEVRVAVETVVADLDGLPDSIDRGALISDVVDEAVGLGPLEQLMKDPDVTEIMVNGAADIFVEKAGRLERSDAVFSDDLAIRNVIERIVAPLGRRIDESSPLVDARLPDGSRVNAIIAPVALKGSTVTIRRFNRQVMSPDDLLDLGTASAAMIDFLRLCVVERKSLVVSGGTGSGKTTLLNVLSNLIPDGERLITIEDAAELRLRHAHLVSLEARPPNAEGRGAVTIRDLVRNALRMRPDRIIVGECRGGEALDMLQAMNTGHEGSLTTVHANTARDALSRLEVMALMSGVDLPLAAIRDQLCSAIDVIVHQSRLRDGSRKIVSIAELTGIESGRIQMQELFRFAQTSAEGPGVQGHHCPTGAIPEFYEALEARGAVLGRSLFDPRIAGPCGPGDPRDPRGTLR
jgi:pilus assembly protein CpaF